MDDMAEGFEQLLRCDYLVEAYDEANRGWRQFLRTGRERDLSGTADPLCAALGALQEDVRFWAALGNLRNEAESHWRDVRIALSDLERLLVLEEQLLERRFGRKRARQLVSDLSLSLGMVHADRGTEPPSPLAIENLRARLRPLTEETCEVAARGLLRRPEDDRPWYGRFYKGVRTVGRAVLVVGGASLVVVNAAAWGTFSVPEVLGSTTGGLSLMLAQFPAAEEEREG